MFGSNGANYKREYYSRGGSKYVQYAQPHKAPIIEGLTIKYKVNGKFVKTNLLEKISYFLKLHKAFEKFVNFCSPSNYTYN